MASIKISGDTSGEITISAPAVAGTNTLTLPANSGEITVGGNNTPFFSVRVGTTQTGVGDAVVTKIAFDTVDAEQGVTFDTTNYKFTVPSGGAGYYHLNAFATAQTSGSTDLSQVYIRPYLNGSASAGFANFIFSASYSRAATPHLSRIYNLSEGDYLEIYGYINSVSTDRQFTAGQCCWTMHKLIT